MQVKITINFFARSADDKVTHLEDRSRISLTADTFGRNLLKLIPGESLPPGEYAVGESGNRTEFCFRVVPS